MIISESVNTTVSNYQKIEISVNAIKKNPCVYRRVGLFWTLVVP